jgi:hypothetical protein
MSASLPRQEGGNGAEPLAAVVMSARVGKEEMKTVDTA